MTHPVDSYYRDCDLALAGDLAATARLERWPLVSRSRGMNGVASFQMSGHTSLRVDRGAVVRLPTPSWAVGAEGLVNVDAALGNHVYTSVFGSLVALNMETLGVDWVESIAPSAGWHSLAANSDLIACVWDESLWFVHPRSAQRTRQPTPFPIHALQVRGREAVGTSLSADGDTVGRFVLGEELRTSWTRQVSKLSTGPALPALVGAETLIQHASGLLEVLSLADGVAVRSSAAFTRFQRRRVHAVDRQGVIVDSRGKSLVELNWSDLTIRWELPDSLVSRVALTAELAVALRERRTSKTSNESVSEVIAVSRTRGSLAWTQGIDDIQSADVWALNGAVVMSSYCGDAHVRLRVIEAASGSVVTDLLLPCERVPRGQTSLCPMELGLGLLAGSASKLAVWTLCANRGFVPSG